MDCIGNAWGHIDNVLGRRSNVSGCDRIALTDIKIGDASYHYVISNNPDDPAQQSIADKNNALERRRDISTMQILQSIKPTRLAVSARCL